MFLLILEVSGGGKSLNKLTWLTERIQHFFICISVLCSRIPADTFFQDPEISVLDLDPSKMRKQIL